MNGLCRGSLLFDPSYSAKIIKENSKETKWISIPWYYGKVEVTGLLCV